MQVKRFFRKLPARLYLLLAALVFVTFFSNDFGLVDIQKTAIILAAGVDRTEEGYRLTAQIAVPKGSDRTTGGTESIEIDGTGETVSDCVTQLYAKTGWVPKFVFCDLVLLGEESARAGALAALDYFLRNEYVPDSCLLAVCEGSAADMLGAMSAIDDASSLALEKLFSDAAKKSGRVTTSTLRTFAIDGYGAGESGYMPYIRMQKKEQNAKSGQGGGQGGGQSGGKAQSGGDEMLFTAEETALFLRGSMTGRLGAEETFAFQLLEGSVYGGTIPADGFTLSVIKNDGGVSIRREDRWRAKFSLSLRVRVASRTEASSPEDIATGALTPEEEARAAALIEDALSSLWTACVEADCDLFGMQRTLFRRGDKTPFSLGDVSPEYEVRVLGLR